MIDFNDGQITLLLERANHGDSGAIDDLMRAVNDELRSVADGHMRRWFGQGLPGVTLQPTALVNEAFLKLIKCPKKYDSRGHFFAIATKVLERVLIDYHRQRAAQIRGGGWIQIPLDPELLSARRDADEESEAGPVPEVLAALDRLEKLDQRKANVVRLRVLWGLTIAEAAEALDVTHATVERDWQFARAWLGKELADS